jgi:carboxylate-amine ligase
VRPAPPGPALLLALSGSSPYWEGEDTGYDSYRTVWFSRFPVTGSPEVLRTRQAYDALVAELVVSGVVDDARGLYWDARPSVLYPTVEVRVADTCPQLDDAVLQAALSRALVRTVAREAVEGRPFPEPRPELVKAARWRAARHGLSGDLADLRTGTRAPGVELVRGLLARLREDLESTGDWEEVSALTEQVLARGTSATQQRRTAREHGLAEVTRELVAQTALS